MNEPHLDCVSKTKKENGYLSDPCFVWRCRWTREASGWQLAYQIQVRWAGIYVRRHRKEQLLFSCKWYLIKILIFCACCMSLMTSRMYISWGIYIYISSPLFDMMVSPLCDSVVSQSFPEIPLYVKIVHSVQPNEMLSRKAYISKSPPHGKESLKEFHHDTIISHVIL